MTKGADERSLLPRQRLEHFRRDPFARRMGFQLVEAGPGYARVAVDLTEDLFNFAGTPHGGLLFSLADYAFSVASNSRGRVSLATNVSIQFMATAELGERLYAVAKENHLTHRTGFYEMTVTTESGRLLARCLGAVHRTSRLLDGDQPDRQEGR